MSNLLTRSQLIGPTATAWSLLDYVVLEAIGNWEDVTRDQVEIHDDERQRVSVILCAAELSSEGFPLDLTLEFSDPNVELLSFISSAAVNETFDVLVQLNLVHTTDRRHSIVRLTSEGRGLLRLLRGRVATFTAVFDHMPSSYFAHQDLIRSGKVARPRPLQAYINDRIGSLTLKSSLDIRAEVLNFAKRLLRGPTPRGYKFDPIFRQVMSQPVGLKPNEDVKRRAKGTLRRVAFSHGS